jgi:hypothetical protein
MAPLHSVEDLHERNKKYAESHVPIPLLSDDAKADGGSHKPKIMIGVQKLPLILTLLKELTYWLTRRSLLC